LRIEMATGKSAGGFDIPAGTCTYSGGLAYVGNGTCYGMGSGDMLEVVHMGLHAAQMTSLNGIRACFDAVTANAAKVMHVRHAVAGSEQAVRRRAGGIGAGLAPVSHAARAGPRGVFKPDDRRLGEGTLNCVAADCSATMPICPARAR
jgi:hypothetical protein